MVNLYTVSSAISYTAVVTYNAGQRLTITSNMEHYTDRTDAILSMRAIQSSSQENLII